ncbi:MAG: ATP synthase F1 subunit gamma [Candidatus Pacebacteria bacterium]|nr:ATP synthase F1 subunit gamma [Candidatus Paceibacterota bacterium]MBP9851949.1 ATP synthase F1 subunit gamma [Candidatus Paceibacterota bacterium]
MASTKEIKRRIKSIKNTKKITKAMELVAASKMKKAVTQTLASRHYAKYSQEVLARVSASIKDSTHPFLSDRGHKKILVVVVTSNKGLCGAYNAQVFRAVLDLLKTKPEREYSFIAVGKKGEAWLRRLVAIKAELNLKIIASFPDLPDAPTLRDTQAIANIAISEYENGTYDRVKVIYTNYVSALSQTPEVLQILPVSKRDIERAVTNMKEHNDTVTAPTTEYVMEPNSESLVIHLIEQLSKTHIYQMLLESIASEQSSRMVAMKNASDAAGEIIDELTLVFNKARQSSITQEISEISAGMASVS